MKVKNSVGRKSGNEKYKALVCFMMCVLMLNSCKRFVEVDPPINKLTPVSVFASEDLTNSAVLGIYSQIERGFGSGGSGSLATSFGVISDEMIGYSSFNGLQSAYENQINAQDAVTNNLWQEMYARIYECNLILEGLNTSSANSTLTKQGFKGEVLFIRAFCYFYLINVYGAVPLNLSTDYTVNRVASRTPINLVYSQIQEDLRQAESLLPDSYPNGKTRVTKFAAKALLSRIYFYLKDWANAEKYATQIISEKSKFDLIPLEAVFLKNSLEAIWQLTPPPSSNTAAGEFLILTSIPDQISTSPDFVADAFETNDLRREIWLGTYVEGNTTYFYPAKYKARFDSNVSEYMMVFRLAEQYLIRSESRAQQNNLIGSIADVDMIRNRSGLSSILQVNPSISKENLLKIISKERRAELFSEWGDRWFDLKRNDKLLETLSNLKLNWSLKNVVMPIPEIEIKINRNINQNNGY